MKIVTDYLDRAGLAYKSRDHDVVARASDRALELGVPRCQVIKAVLLVAGSGHALAVLPASRMLSPRFARQATGCPGTRLATEDEILRFCDWCELGALPALPELLGVPAYVDPSVLDERTGYFAAGTRTQSIELDPAEIYLGRRGVTAAPLFEH